MTPPQACPDESILREYLQEQLAAADAERIDDHIGGCPACQRALDRLVGSLPGRWLPDPDGAEGEALLTHAATASLGVMPRVLVRAIEPGGPDGPVASTGSPGMTATADAAARIHLFGEIARGGMGAILKGRDVALGRDLAVKILLNRHRHNPGLVRRFVMEARIAGQLQHPGTVPIHELGTLDDGRPYFAMKLVKGRTLAALLKERTDPSQNRPRLLGIFEQICQTVAYAHARGIIHRDLKPANVMVGRFGEVQVMDWGLAKVLAGTDVDAAEDGGGDVAFDNAGDDSGDLTNPGSVLGTWPYMAPEQARGLVAEVDRRSDVFGLGAILCEILTGGPPYIGPDSMSVRLQAMEGRPDEVSARLEGCGADSELIQLARRCLAPNPADRPADGGEVASAVAAYLSGVQERLQQERLARERQEVRAAEGRRRHRILVAATLSVSLTLALGVVASTIFALRERAARQKAGREAFRATQSEQAAQEANAHTIAALNDMRKAQAETKEALAQSEESRKQAEAVSSFLVEAFRSPDPEQTGRDVKVIDVLNQASIRLEHAFAGSQAVKGALLHALGQTYLGIGIYDRAVVLLTEARAVRETALGQAHRDTLTTSNRLAIAFRYAGRLADSIALHELTLRRREVELGPEHADTLDSRGNLAIAFWAAGRFQEAIALNEAVLKARERELGADHLLTLRSRNNLALAYRAVGRLPEAIALYERTLRISQARLGPDDLDTLSIRSNLAGAYRYAGYPSKAIALDEATLRLREAKQGPDHPDTLKNRTNLGIDYLDAGRLTEAIATHEATRKLMEAKLGPDHPSTLRSRDNLAAAYLASGRLTDALALSQATLELCEIKLGPDHPLALESRGNLALAHDSSGELSVAEGLLRDMLARLRKGTRRNDILMSTTLTELGRNLLRQGNCSEAEPLLREAVAIVEKASPDDWNRYDALSLLGWSLLGQRRYAEAEPVLISAYEELKAREDRMPVPQRSRLRQAAERVVRLYEDWQKPDQATAWKVKVGMRDLPADVFARP